MNTKILAHLAVGAVALIYGSNYVIAKGAMATGQISPTAFILCRVVFATLMFVAIHQIWVKEKLEKSDLGLAALCGLFGVATNQLCFFQGLHLTSPMHASLIMITTPVIVLVLSFFILKSKIHWRQVLGVFLGLAGAALLIQSAGTTEKISSIKGDLFIMANATSYALYLVLVKRLLVKYHPYTVLKWVFLFGMIFAVPFGVVDFMNIPFSELPMSVWLGLGYVLLFTTFLAYLLNGYALSIIEPSTVSFYIYFQPFIASIISIYLSQDNLDATKLQSAILLFIGVYLVLAKPSMKRVKT